MPEKCVCEKPRIVGSPWRYPAAHGKLWRKYLMSVSGLSCTIPNGTVAPG